MSVRRPLLVALSAFALAVPLAVVAAPVASADPSPNGISHRSARVCPRPGAGDVACSSLVVVDSAGKPQATTTPAGYGPTDLQGAYNLTGAIAKGSGKTVAIVDAYDDPNALTDLNVYRAHFFSGSPALNSPGGPTFAKVNQTGSQAKRSLPTPNKGWAEEISLDLDMVSAICPNCKILLVEASSSSFANLGTAVNYAAGRPGVVAISNSYGGSDSTQTSAYNHPGIAITASTGDSGYGVQSPASYDSVVAVGGTSLSRSSASTRGWSEAAWSGAGSGCSTLNPKPAWQTNDTSCSDKAVADVSAVADPNTGVAVYDSTPAQGMSGWMVFGGTSSASPIIAAVFALAGNTGSSASTTLPYPSSLVWGNAASLNDITSGSNGNCSTPVWCTAGTGWDGPTGLGTPNGTSGF